MMSDFFKIFGFFFRQYRKETVSVVLLVLLAGLVEAIGVAAFLPFFQIVLEKDADFGFLPEPFAQAIERSGITISFTTVSLFLITAIVIKSAILWFSLRRVGFAVARIAADLRSRLLDALLTAQWRFFVSHNLGEGLNSLIFETYRSSMAFITMARFIAYTTQLTVYALGALIVSWQVFMVAVAVGFIAGVLLRTLIRISRRAGREQTELAKYMLTDLADMLQGVKPLRAMVLEGKFTKLLSAHSKKLEKAQSDELIASQYMRIFHEPLMVITGLAVMGSAIAWGDLTVSALAVMALIFMRLLSSLNSAQNEYQRLMAQESALWSLLSSIQNTEVAREAWPGKNPVPDTFDCIELENIDFSYGDKKILQGASLQFDARSLTALIGPSGGGKTTIMDLVSGFYMPAAGKIKIDGHDLSDLDLKEWRYRLGFVPQEVFLFNDTILENIRVGRNDISEEQVWKALEEAGARSFVEKLSKQLQEPVGENGRMLSGGQRQRIAIARAIVHRPDVLLLDEATSALDKETEKVLLDTIRNLSRTMTVIFVSHNPSVVDYADRVYQVSDGKVLRKLNMAAD